MSQIDVSYGILHYNPGANSQARDALYNAVCSLKKNAILPHEVFVIDQGNPYAEASYTSELAIEAGYNFIGLKQNIGISRGINLLANIARGEYISLVTSDVEFTEGLDKTLINILEKNSDIWQICPASDKSDIVYQRRGYKDSGIIRTIAQELTIQFWPRDVFQKIGYFDERWKACYENLDFALRIFLAGGFAAISHDAFCPHDFHMSMRSGARDHAYEGYSGMTSGFDQSVLQQLWEAKWPQVRRYIDMYEPILYLEHLGGLRDIMLRQYKTNVHLPYVQSVGY